jgi:hypothetical protein
LQYEKVDVSSSESEETESSDEGEASRPDTAKRFGSKVPLTCTAWEQEFYIT